MPSIDALPPDQRAVLELVLKRGRTYDEIAQLLSIDRAGVRQRALAALDALGPDANVPAERRALITDYLLGALPRRVTEQVRDRLAQSASERAWARVIAAELEPISANPLPEIPADAGAARPEPPAPAPRARREAERPSRPEPGRREPRAAAEAEESAADEKPRRRRPSRRERSPKGRRGRLGPGSRLEPGRERPPSRRGGKLVLLAAAVIVLIVILSIALSGGGSKGGHTTPAASTPTTATTTPTTATTSTTSTATTSTTSTTGQSAKIVAQVNLNAPAGGSAKGVAEILKAGSTEAVAIIATHVTPNKAHDAYAVWVYNSATDAHRLGFVSPGVGSSGKLQTEGGLPANAAHYHHLIITLETQSNPKTPGPIVLEGDLTGLS